jgi:hypothetical protein
MIWTRGLCFDLCLIHSATSSSETPEATQFLNSSPEISVKLKKKLSSGQSKTAPSKISATVASGLNLTIAAITLWNTVYLSRAVAEKGSTLAPSLAVCEKLASGKNAARPKLDACLKSLRKATRGSTRQKSW